MCRQELWFYLCSTCSQIDLLEDRITINLPENWVDTTDMEQMIQKLQEVEIAEKQMEISIDQAEQVFPPAPPVF